MDKNAFTINILLNGVRMPLNIRREDEEIYRNAEKLVNKYLEQYRSRFSQRSMAPPVGEAGPEGKGCVPGAPGVGPAAA